MSETLFRSKARPTLSPTRQALSDAIQSLRVLEAQRDALSASIEYDGKAAKAVSAANAAIIQAEEDLKSAQRNHVAEMAGGATATVSPRQARDAIARAKEDLSDASIARTQIERQITSFNTQINMARSKRDSCVNAVLAEHYGPKVADLASEIAALQHCLVQKAQLLYELAGTVVPHNVTRDLPQAMERIDISGQGLAWQMPTSPAPLLAAYRNAVAQLKTDATTEVE